MSEVLQVNVERCNHKPHSDTYSDRVFAGICPLLKVSWKGYFYLCSIQNNVHSILKDYKILPLFTSILLPTVTLFLCVPIVFFFFCNIEDDKLL